MKKMVCLLLCLLFLGTFLVSCGEGEFGKYLENYDYVPEQIEDITLNLYIIVDSGTVSNAITTVARRINQFTTSNFHTTLSVQYIAAEEYESRLLAAVDGQGATPDIFLVNSKSLYDTLRQKDALADLTAYYDMPAYGKLNTIVAESLLDVARADGSLYVVPNNHVVGHYEYLLIDKATARDKLNYSNSELLSYTTYEQTADLRAKMTENGYDADSCVKVVEGKYEDRAIYMQQGYYCNIVSCPQATEEEVYSSAFAIGAGCEYVERAMEIIYAINTDEELRNTLQYGIRGTNYNLDAYGNVVRVSDEENTYRMNPLYTGNLFLLYYCNEIGWTKDVADNGRLQNDASVPYTAPESSDEEAA